MSPPSEDAPENDSPLSLTPAVSPEPVTPAAPSPLAFDFDLAEPKPTATPPQNPRFRLWQAGVVIVGLLLYSILSPLFGKTSSDYNDKAAHANDSLDALRTAKTAYNFHYSGTATPSPLPKLTSSSKGNRLPRTEEDALADYRRLANAKAAQSSDWRRLGILAFAFGSNEEGANAFRHLATLPLAPPPQKKDALKAPSPDPIPRAEESAVWEAIYGPKPLDANNVSAYRATLSKLNLNWFEHLAAAALYTKAGRDAEAAHERAAAYAATTGLLTMTGIQTFAFFVGAAGLLRLLFSRKARLRLRENRETLFALYRARGAQAFTTEASLFAFVVYLGMMMFIGLTLLPFRSWLHSLPYQAVVRASLVIELLGYIPVAGAALYTLRFLTASQSPTRTMPTLRETLVSLGFRSANLAADIGAGIRGYMMCLPVAILFGLLSSYLFQKFQTPPNPVTLLSAMTQNPLDKLLILALSSVAAPIVEEMMFRGLLYPALRSKWGITRAVLLSASVFALVHNTLPGGFLTLASLGASFALAYQWRGGSLVPSITMHALNNGLLMLIYFAIVAK